MCQVFLVSYEKFYNFNFFHMTGNKDKWEFYKDAQDKWRWRRTAPPPNSQIVGASHESYANKSDCIANAKRHGYTE